MLRKFYALLLARCAPCGRSTCPLNLALWRYSRFSNLKFWLCGAVAKASENVRCHACECVSPLSSDMCYIRSSSRGKPKAIEARFLWFCGSRFFGLTCRPNAKVRCKFTVAASRNRQVVCAITRRCIGHPKRRGFCAIRCAHFIAQKPRHFGRRLTWRYGATHE